MTVNIAYATVDGGVYSLNANWTTARTGPGFATTNTEYATWGESAPGYGNGGAGNYVVDQALFSFPFSVTTGHRVAAAYVQLLHTSNNGSASRGMVIKSQDWGGTLDTGDFLSMLPSYTSTIHGYVYDVQNAGVNTWLRAGSDLMRQAISGSGNYRIVCFSQAAYGGTTPTGDHRSSIATLETGGTTNDPRLVYLSTPVSTLLGHVGACAQLSDGTHVYVEAVDNLASPYSSLKHRTAAGTVTTLATGVQSSILDANNTSVSLQDVALVVDPSDNVYLLTASGATLQAEAYVKGSGHTWTRQTMLSGNFSYYASPLSFINNLVACWHDTALAGGTIAVYGMHHPGEGHEDFQVYGLIDADTLLAGTGTLLRTWSELPSSQLTQGAASDFVNFPNETGTGLDVATLPGTGLDAGLASYNRVGGFSVSRIRLTDYANLGTAARSTSTWAITKDSNSKLRVLPINASTFAVVAGSRVEIWANTTGSTLTRQAAVDLSAQGMTTFPTATAMATTAAWDAVYDAGSQKVWVYYFSSASSRRLMRTAVNTVTGLPTLEETEVDPDTGASGSTMLAIRAPRGQLTGTAVLITVAEKLSGGTNTTTTVVDTLNNPPTAPTLTPKANFDATGAATFAWTFNDPNPSDTQSEYDFQINTATGVSVVSTGWVASGTSSRNITGGTLTNGVEYQWRVRTKDAAGEIGPWSDFGTFSTAAGGNVTITAPATDNPAGVIDDQYLVQWSVSGTTQASYRVVVVRQDTGAEIENSGWVTSVATDYTVQGLVTDVEHQIQVTVRNGALVSSGTGTRLITPSYGLPEVPILSVQPYPDEGYILLSVTNPAPGSVLIGTTEYTFEVDAEGWEGFDATVARDTAQDHSGVASLKITSVGTPAQAYARPPIADSPAIAPGQRYTVRFWAYSAAGYADLGAAIDWYDGVGAYLSTSAASAAIPAATWTMREQSGTAPVDAASARFGPTLGTNPPNGTILYLDDVILVAANDLPEVSTNQILRREAGSTGPYTIIGETDESGQFRDYTAAAGKTYEYVARGVA